MAWRLLDPGGVRSDPSSPESATMPSRRSLLSLLALAAVLPLGACGGEVEPAEPPARAAAAEGSPFGDVPFEELYGASPLDNLWSPRVELEVPNLPPGWHGARLAILSDFQLGLWPENEAVAEAAIRRAVEADPEFVVLLGDFVAVGTEVEPLRRILAPLRGRRAVAVLGDRDVRTDSLEARVAGVLQEAGVRLLRNDAAGFELGGDTAWIAGLDAEVIQRSFGDQQFIVATLGVSGRTPILLTHAPALASRAPEGRFPVILGGNTFCGQVEVPGTPRLSWLRDEALPGAVVEGVDRLFRVSGGTLLVTCGLGYGFVPLRFGAPPEVPILTLVRLGAPPAAGPVQEAVADTTIQRFQGAPADSL